MKIEELDRIPGPRGMLTLSPPIPPPLFLWISNQYFRQRKSWGSSKVGTRSKWGLDFESVPVDGWH